MNLVIPNRAEGPVRNLLLTVARAHHKPSPRKTGKGTSSTRADQARKNEERASAPESAALVGRTLLSAALVFIWFFAFAFRLAEILRFAGGPLALPRTS